MSIGLLSGGSQQLNQTTSLVATGTNDVFTFPNPPTGYVWSGTLSVTAPSASQLVPVGALMTANVGATSWGEWGGNSVFGPVQANQSQQLVVTAQGLTAGVTYLLNWIGSSDPAHVVQPLYPAANSTALTAQITQTPPGAIGTFTGLTGTVTGVPASVRTMVVQISSTSNVVTNLNVSNVGPPSFEYYNQAPYLLEGLAPFTYVVVIPISPVGTTNGFTFIVTTAAGIPTVSVFGDTSIYTESIYYNGVVLAASIGLVTAGTTTVIEGPCRLLTANVRSSTSTANAYLLIDGTEILNSNGAASQTVSNSLTFPPNTILPSGSRLQLLQVGAGFSEGSVTYCYP